jgi:CO/xanthine dehydrogenase Mo-binding subunit
MTPRSLRLASLPRRNFLKTGGAMVIGFSLGGVRIATVAAQSANLREIRPGPPPANQIDTWIAIHNDNTATVYVGFAELGQGNSTALPQIAAEELDLGMDQVRTVPLDTHLTPNQGGTYSSASIARGGPQVRTAAAEARQALLGMASERLGVPASDLAVSRGVVADPNDPSRTVTYGELIGNRLFNLEFTGSAPVKDPAGYQVVATAAPRADIPAKVQGSYAYMQHLRRPDMLHGRVIRPRGQAAYGHGAPVIAIDESSIADIPGVRIVRRGDFIGVVAPEEWHAVRAAEQLDVTWDRTPSIPSSDDVYAAMRAIGTDDAVVLEEGDVEAAATGAAHRATFSADCPYQAHAGFGPNCALADVGSDFAEIACSTQDVYGTRRLLSGILGLDQSQVRVQYHEGSGTYGHSCWDDVAIAAAIMSQETGQPVRVQFMRWDEHGWDNYGPAHVGEARIAADADGNFVSYEYDGWHHNWSNVETSAQLAGLGAAAEWPTMAAQMVNPRDCGGMYALPSQRLVNHHVPGLGFLKAGWLRSPLDLSFSFISEQAVDRLAFMVGMDPYELRLRNIRDERWQGVLDAVAEASNWTPRPPAGNLSDQNVVTGRGIGLGTHLQSWGGAVAEIEVTKDTGRIRVIHVYGAIDAGLAVNPGNVEAQITGQLVQTVSRMLLEEVTFDETGVTSLDWSSYPMLRFEDCPEVTPIVVQRINEPSAGAGEEVMAAAAAAIANAFFDATGVQMRRYPMTRERVRAALELPTV